MSIAGSAARCAAVVREAGVKVVGVNNNEIQLDKAKSLNAEAGLDHMVDYLACSFMDLDAIADDRFDPRLTRSNRRAMRRTRRARSPRSTAC